MKKIAEAMSDISYEYINELKTINEPIVRRRPFKAIIIAATLSALFVCVSLFAVIGSQPPETPIIPPEFSETLSENASENSDDSYNNVSTEINESSDYSDETSNQNTSIPNDNSSSDETSAPDENSNNESSYNPPYIDETDADFTAQQMADIFSSREDSKTNQYMVFRFGDVGDIKTASIPQSDLPILFERDWEYAYQKWSLGGDEARAIYIDGKTIILPEDVSYDEVYEIAVEWLPHCQKYFGFKYRDIKVRKVSSTYEIVYFDSSEIYPYFANGKPIMYTNSYVSLQIGTNIGSSNIITLMCVLYKTENNSFDEGDRYNTITLQEAEGMLNNGYVFGGHTCPICMQEQEKVDFSDYDHVGIEYVQKATYEELTNEYYPFYAFYKEIGDGLFARTYVPAFRVSGVEEYFRSQESKHVSFETEFVE